MACGVGFVGALTPLHFDTSEAPPRSRGSSNDVVDNFVDNRVCRGRKASNGGRSLPDAEKNGMKNLLLINDLRRRDAAVRAEWCCELSTGAAVELSGSAGRGAAAH